MASKVRAWLLANRTSVRLAFAFRLFGMFAGSLFSLLWTRLLLRAMGDALFGLFLSFQSVTRLGGLGDLGMSGAVALRAGQHLGRGENDQLQRFLASARSLFLLFSVLAVAVFIALSPWLPFWLHFEQLAEAGSLPLLFALGGVSVGVLIVSGYLHSLNFAHGTVTWPILPAIFIGQILAPFGHWLLARLGLPLWVQLLPYIACSLVTGLVAIQFLRWSHPYLGKIRPLGFDRSEWRGLAFSSGWVYLCTLGRAIYHTVDRLVINAGFGPQFVPMYQANYKLTELSWTLVVTASTVAIPKLTQWVASGDPADRARVVHQTRRLNLFQTLLGCAAALAYLALNDSFMRLWLGPRYLAPALLQFAFAWNLAVSTSGDAGIQLAGRFGMEGIRNMGIAVGGTGLLNLALSYLAMKIGFLEGVAFATVIAQSALSLILGWDTCRRLEFSFGAWLAKSWLFPSLIVLGAFGLRAVFLPESVLPIAKLLGCYFVLLVGLAFAIGANRKMLAEEWRIVRGMIGR